MKNNNDFNNCILLKKINCFDKAFYFLKNKKNYFKERKQNFRKTILNIIAGTNKVFVKISNLFRGKEKILLKKIDVFISPMLAVPHKIQQYKNIKCYTVLHDAIPLIYKEFYPDIKRDDYWFSVLINSEFNKDKRNNFLAISRSTKDDFVKYVPSISQEQIVVMPIATSQKFYPDKDLEKLNKVLDKYSVPQNKIGKYIFSLCTLEPRKNLIFTIKCFIEFIKKNNIDDLYFYLGGGHWEDFIGQLEKEIDDLDKYKDKIVKLGYIDDEDVNILYSNSLFFTYISLYKGFGMPPLEAMSCGVPVLTSNTSSIPEVVGNSAIMINPTDKQACISAMEKLYFNEDLRRELSIKGLEQSKNFSWAKSIEIINNILEK